MPNSRKLCHWCKASGTKNTLDKEEEGRGEGPDWRPPTFDLGYPTTSIPSTGHVGV